MDPGLDCSSQVQSCCSVQRSECCRDSVGISGASLSGPAIASSGCSDCCREYSLAEMDPPIALFELSLEGSQTALEELTRGAGVCPVSVVRAPSVLRRVAPAERPSGLPIYLLSCCFLI